jgi:hypothetical protein
MALRLLSLALAVYRLVLALGAEFLFETFLLLQRVDNPLFTVL